MYDLKTQLPIPEPRDPSMAFVFMKKDMIPMIRIGTLTQIIVLYWQAEDP